MTKNKYLKGFAFSFIITIVIVSFYTGFSGFKESLESLKSYSYKYAFFVMGIMILKLITESLILIVSLRSVEKKLGFLNALKITILGAFFNYLTPFYTGGQPFQIYYLTKNNVDASVATAVILYKSMFFQICLFFVGLFGAIYAYMNFSRYLFFAVLIGMILNGLVVFLILLFSLNEKLSKKTVIAITMGLKKIKIIKEPEKYMNRIMDEVENFVKFFRKNAKGVLDKVIIIILSFLQIFLFQITIPIIFKGNGIDFSLDLFMKSIVQNIGASIVPTPGTSGGAEGYFYMIFNSDAVSAVVNSTLIIWRMCTYYFILFVGFLAFTFGYKKQKNSL
ncbi:MAG TPA: lysylphosphatidylglycerol synthase transmembrane domain-containing protein [Tepiditoga sp.]|nr:lysylphosphatidylglycerol synthase transmembrane domain-containing protein [Tepiditoga sp.]